MPRHADSGQLDLAEVFRRVQEKMKAEFAIGGMFEHSSANGNAAEMQWIELLRQYLPQRYGVAPAFIINAAGRRSRQIDIAIFDCSHSAPLFPHSAGIHVPIESVYAVFEVKAVITATWLQDAAEKVASVRELRTGRRRILGGLLAASSIWSTATFAPNLKDKLGKLRGHKRLDLGCALDTAAFERRGTVVVSEREQALLFFVMRLIDRLNGLGQARPPDLGSYFGLGG